ncbi:MAG TPA: ATP-dependent 6-phosphofructokinase [Acidobacteriota bacterium]|nr:ATP-dependent 6-phosphofructokinase [Acidobacteriota bacterium]
MKIGLLTGGGDCPGLNAVIRAVVRTAYFQYGFVVMGIEDGYEGLLSPMRVRPLGIEDVKGILGRGGTILGTSNRKDPFRFRNPSTGQSEPQDRSEELVENFRRLRLDGLIVVGGDGSLSIAHELMQKGIPVVGVPKTIDNDIAATEYTFGFDTAVNTATEALDKLQTTAESHHRVMYLEVMGRNAGWIAIHAGLAGGADVILIPEIPFRFDRICSKIEERIAGGRNFSVVVVAEGVRPPGGSEVYVKEQEELLGAGRLGGVAEIVCREVSRLVKQESRVTVLGHLQRGGGPTPFDRALATRFGSTATHLIAEKQFGMMVALQCNRIVPIPLEEVIGKQRLVPPGGELVRIARSMGISFGD